MVMGMALLATARHQGDGPIDDRRTGRDTGAGPRGVSRGARRVVVEIVAIRPPPSAIAACPRC